MDLVCPRAYSLPLVILLLTPFSLAHEEAEYPRQGIQILSVLFPVHPRIPYMNTDTAPDVKKFKDNWLHPGKTADVLHVYLASKSDLQTSARAKNFARAL